MSLQQLTINLPEPLYNRLKQRAAQTQRSVEAELVDVVALALPVADALPTDLAEAISQLALLNDSDLWRAARSTLPAEAAERLEALHLKRQREGLAEQEEDEVASLTRQYERVMLVRAHAAQLLKQRGHDVSSLLTQR